MRSIAVAFTLALASTAQATPPVQVAQPDQMVTQVRQGCGAGMVRRAGVCVPRGGVAAAGYASSTNLAGGYANSPGYAYGPGPAYGAGPGPGYAYGAGTGYMAGPPHEPGGPVHSGHLCWSDRDPWANTGQGYWKSC
jgi:hypothetical protein